MNATATMSPAVVAARGVLIDRHAHAMMHPLAADGLTHQGPITKGHAELAAKWEDAERLYPDGARGKFGFGWPVAGIARHTAADGSTAWLLHKEAR